MKHYEKSVTVRLVPVVLCSTVVWAYPAWSCPECRAQVNSGIYNQDFAGNLLVVLLPVLILVAIGGGLYFVDHIAAKARKGTDKWLTRNNAAYDAAR